MQLTVGYFRIWLPSYVQKEFKIQFYYVFHLTKWKIYRIMESRNKLIRRLNNNFLGGKKRGKVILVDL